jgi:hypothetical protein
MEERKVRKLTNKLKLLYSKLERENNMLEQIGAHKSRYRAQSNDREDKLIARIEEEARAMNIQLQALITEDSGPAQPATSKEPAGSSKEHAAMPPSRIFDVTSHEEEEGKQETAQEKDTMDLTTGPPISPRRPKSKRPSLQTETEKDEPRGQPRNHLRTQRLEKEKTIQHRHRRAKKRRQRSPKPGKHNATNTKHKQQNGHIETFLVLPQK